MEIRTLGPIPLSIQIFLEFGTLFSWQVQPFGIGVRNNSCLDQIEVADHVQGFPLPAGGGERGGIGGVADAYFRGDHPVEIKVPYHHQQANHHHHHEEDDGLS